MSHLNCTVNNAYSSLDSNQGFPLWYGIISPPLNIETIKNVVNSIEHELIIQLCLDCLHCGVWLETDSMFLLNSSARAAFLGCTLNVNC